jgi:Tfp pilus assembly protein PilX
MRITRRYLSSLGDRGVALVLVMLSLLVLTVLGATIVFTARSETLASYNFKLDTQADYLAKAGIQYAVNWLRSGRYISVQQTTPYTAPQTAPPDTYYSVTPYTNSYGMTFYTANNSQVQCKTVSGTGISCSAGAVQLIGYGSGTSNYPFATAATNFASDLVNVAVTGDANNSGTFSINAYLLNYRTVNANNGAAGVFNVVPQETWLITSQGTWLGSSQIVATAEEQAVVQPIYSPTFGNAMYGYCGASMNGSLGTCTDAYNSALGAYAAGNSSVISGNCDQTTNNNVISTGAGIGANGGVTLIGNVNVSGDVTIGQSPPSSCSTSGFSGSTSNITNGQVVSGPNIPQPATPPFPPFPPTNASDFPGSGSTAAPDYNATKTLPTSSGAVSATTTFTPPGTTACGGNPCTVPCEGGSVTCNGSSSNPYLINYIHLTGSDALTLYGGPDALHPVTYYIDRLSSAGNSTITINGYVVLNVKTSLSLNGNGLADTGATPEKIVINTPCTGNCVSLSGNGAIGAVVTAPYGNVDLSGCGNNGYFTGAIKGYNVSMGGGCPLHYDIQLSKLGGIMGTMMVSGYNRKKM